MDHNLCFLILRENLRRERGKRSCSGLLPGIVYPVTLQSSWMAMGAGPRNGDSRELPVIARAWRRFEPQLILAHDWACRRSRCMHSLLRIGSGHATRWMPLCACSVAICVSSLKKFTGKTLNFKPSVAPAFLLTMCVPRLLAQ